MAAKYGNNASETINGTASIDTVFARGGMDSWTASAAPTSFTAKKAMTRYWVGFDNDRLTGALGWIRQATRRHGGVTAASSAGPLGRSRADTLVAMEDLGGGPSQTA